MMGPAISLSPFMIGRLHRGPRILEPRLTRIGARASPTLVGILSVTVTELLLEVIHTEVIGRRLHDG
jgi:hypothetical protein